MKVEITEILSRIVEIETEDEDDAINIAGVQYANEEIVLGAEDFMDVKFEVVKWPNQN